MGKKGYVINIGLNNVDREHYPNSLGWATAEPGAMRLHDLFKGLCYKSEPLLYDEATTSALKVRLRALAKKMKAEDMLVLSFCGHGKGVQKEFDVENSELEDEGWCMYDRVLFHFELWELASLFKKGVKIVLISDACNSGPTIGVTPETELVDPDEEYKPNVFEKHKSLYDEILSRPRIPRKKVDASVVVMSGSKEDSKTYEGSRFSYFTEALLCAWKNREPEDDYYDFFEHVQRYMFHPNRPHQLSSVWHYHEGRVDTRLPFKRTFMYND